MIFSNKGMSLIEIMVAIAILGVAFFGLIQAFPTAIKIVNSAENKTRASYYAQEKIEEIYQLDYDLIASGTIEAKGFIGASGTKKNNFQRETEVFYIDGDMNVSMTDLGLKLITTNVYYRNSFTKNEEVFSLSTIISRRQ